MHHACASNCTCAEGLRIYLVVRAVYQIPLLSKCLYVNLFLTKRYSNFFYFDHGTYIYTCTMFEWVDQSNSVWSIIRRSVNHSCD